jgi:hypothetical protein
LIGHDVDRATLPYEVIAFAPPERSESNHD